MRLLGLAMEIGGVGELCVEKFDHPLAHLRGKIDVGGKHGNSFHSSLRSDLRGMPRGKRAFCQGKRI